jgi:hypothetical protein
MIRNDDSYNLLARPVALEHQNPTIIDDRDIEALALSAHIDADPYSHASSMPHPAPSALWLSAEALTNPSLP